MRGEGEGGGGGEKEDGRSETNNNPKYTNDWKFRVLVSNFHSGRQ